MAARRGPSRARCRPWRWGSRRTVQQAVGARVHADRRRGRVAPVRSIYCGTPPAAHAARHVWRRHPRKGALHVRWMTQCGGSWRSDAAYGPTCRNASRVGAQWQRQGQGREPPRGSTTGSRRNAQRHGAQRHDARHAGALPAARWRNPAGAKFAARRAAAGAAAAATRRAVNYSRQLLWVLVSCNNTVGATGTDRHLPRQRVVRKAARNAGATTCGTGGGRLRSAGAAGMRASAITAPPPPALACGRS